MSLCQCGCGRDAGVFDKTRSKQGIRKGAPRKFINGHQWKVDLDKSYVVDPITGCWVWQRHKSNGYGRVAHRLAYQLFYERAHGPKPEGMQLDHLCRNRACVNPAHLEPVTRKENVRRGATARLTVEKVAEIKAMPNLHIRGAKTRVAKQYGIGRATLGHILAGTHWGDIEPTAGALKVKP